MKEIEKLDLITDKLNEILMDSERISSKIAKYGLEEGIIDSFLDFLQKTYEKRDRLLKEQEKLYNKISR